MSLQRKSTLVLGVALLAILLAALALVRAGMLRDFANLETESVERDLARLRAVVNREVDGLDAQTVDWAHWDDTYDYVRGEDDEYVDVNLTEDTFINLNLDLALYADEAGKPVYTAVLRDEELTDEEAPAEILEGLSDGRLVTEADRESNRSGILIADGVPWLLGIRPILLSYGPSQRAGTLVMGRRMDEGWVSDLGAVLEVEAQIEVLDFGAVSSSDTSYGVSSPSEDTVVGWTNLLSVYDTPAVKLSTSQPRLIYSHGQASARLVLGAILLTGLAFLLTTSGLMHRLVLQPVAALAEAVDHARAAGADELDLPARSEDELGRLTDNVRALFHERASQRSVLEARTLQLAVARDQALDALRLRTQTLANLSHDARTPLNVIQLSAQAMGEGVYGPLDPKLDKPIERILLGCRQLQTFANNLLEESKSSAVARIEPHFEDIAVGEILHEVSALMQPLAVRKGLILSTEIAADMPARLRCDRERVVQILINLVDNAIKFTEEGGVSIHVLPPDSTHWTITVQDSGPGIPEADRERVFGPFWQQDASLTRAVNRGVGLGLYVVRELSQALNGTIEVGEADQGGSRFVLRLPLDPRSLEDT